MFAGSLHHSDRDLNFVTDSSPAGLGAGEILHRRDRKATKKHLPSLVLFEGSAYSAVKARGHYSIDCSSLPGLKRTALPGGIETSAPVRGLRPIPVLRGRTLNTPKPRSSMRSPLERARFMLSNTVSTASSALVLVVPVLLKIGRAH